MAVDLERTDRTISIRLPWNREHNPGHAVWFRSPDVVEDPNPEAVYGVEPPQQLDFVDTNGPVALVGCRAAGYTSNVAFGVGLGRIDADFAVIGARDARAFHTINGMRSEVEGLGTWLEMRSLSLSHEADAEGRLTTATMRLESPPAIFLAASPRTELRPAYRYGPGDHADETVIKERSLVQTTARSAVDWWEHLDRHFAVRDLVRLASWRRANFLSHEVTRTSDPHRMLDGSTRGQAWRAMETARTDKADDASEIKYFDFLFRFDDVSRAGVQRWMALHAQEARVVQPVLKLLELEGASLETHMSQLGMGLESLGYRTALAQGVSKRVAKDEPLVTRLERVVAGLRADLPFDPASCAKRITDAYNGVKHANRSLPSASALYLAYQLGIQIFRAWVMRLLGVPAGRTAELLKQDRVTRSIQSLAEK